MHGSVRKYRMDPELVETVAVKVEDGFVPIVSKLPGFVSYMVFEGEDGLIVTVSVFETEEAANQSADAAREWIKENVSDYVQEPLDVMTGELIVSAPVGAVW